MQTGYRWLQELVAFDLAPHDLAERLTATGTAVQSIRPLAGWSGDIRVAEVVRAEPHPSADRLTVCRVRIGDGEKTVVCGAPNVRAGLKVVWVAPGQTLPGGEAIGTSELRGVRSEGMLCSETELGLFGDDRQIIELPADAPVGKPAADLYDEIVLSFELTPNRPDCLSTFGVAREVAAITGGRFTVPAFERTPEGAPLGDFVDVQIEDREGCPRYAVALIEGVKVGPSPFWLRQRVLAAGMRPINNLVDITNFVMMECGQPLHAFDFDRLGRKQIVVRGSREGETFTTLDSKSHRLPAGVVLITDGSETVALGGVMGGLNSEVSDSTTTVLLESAYFDPRRTRRTRKALGIESEAALRFEKGTDPNGVPYALERAAHLMAALAGGQVRRGTRDLYPQPIAPRELTLRPGRVARILGVDIPTEEVKGYLTALDLEVTAGSDDASAELQVRVPTFRPDLEREIDLIEEVARLYGQERIPTRERGGGRLYDRPDRDTSIEEEIHHYLSRAGYSEAVTNSMGTAADYRQFVPEPAPVTISNPISEELACLRSNLCADLARTAALNFNHRNLDWKLYTVGVVFTRGASDQPPAESWHLGLAQTGLAEPRHWQSADRPTDWFELKGAIETLFARLRLAPPGFEPRALSGFDAEASFAVVAGGVAIGSAGRVGAKAAAHWDLKQALWLAELDLDLLRSLVRSEPAYEPLPRFPAVTRDLAIVVDEPEGALAIEQTIHEAGGELLSNVELFDLYRGKPLPTGQKSLAFSLEFRSPARSLTADEVDRQIRNVVDALAARHRATLRT